MKIFVSYAREQRAIAESLSVRLLQEKHDSFFDVTSLPAGEGYDARIRSAIEESDLFIFLISPRAVRAGSYALTEMEIARSRWPDPSGHVLPVMVEPTPMDTVPPYLKAVTVLQPQGNLEADVLSRVGQISGRHRSGRWRVYAGLAGLAVGIAVAAFVLLRPAPGGDGTVVAGSVKDAVTGAPIAGAELRIQNGSDVLGNGTSDDAGNFQLAFDIASRPAARNLKLAVRRTGYSDASHDVRVTSSHPDRTSYPVELLPSAVADCRRRDGHTVVVGYFRPPTGASSQGDLSSRIRDTLDQVVLPQLQGLKIAMESQPLFIACEEIKPQALADYTSLAKVLMADAFLSGYVTPAGIAGSQKVKVEMSIADRFGLLSPPARASSPNIDLDDPATAHLQPEAMSAIFTALIAGYERSGQAEECIQAANAAEQAIGTLPAELSAARERCKKATPNSGLTRPAGGP